MVVARELQSLDLIAQTLTFQSDHAYYTGDVKTALMLAQQAAESARAKEFRLEPCGGRPRVDRGRERRAPAEPRGCDAVADRS